MRGEDFKYENGVLAKYEILRPNKPTFEERFTQSRESAIISLGLVAKDVKNKETITNMMKYCDNSLGSDELLETWQITSGMAHGFTWAQHHFSREQERVNPLTGETYIHRDLDIDRLAYVHCLAHDLFAQAYERWSKLCSVTPERLPTADAKRRDALPGWGKVYERLYP